jgi:hypothetical protein
LLTEIPTNKEVIHIFNIRLRPLWPAFIAMTMVAIACTANNGPEEITRIGVQGRAVIYSSIEQLIEKFDAVVIGHFSEGKTEKVIPTKKSLDSDEINPEISQFGSVYNLSIERYLMGEGADSLDYYQYEGAELTTELGKVLRADDSSTARTKPTASQRYLLFIRYPEDHPEIVVGTALPSRFILADGNAVPDSLGESILELFPVDSEANFISRVEKAAQKKTGSAAGS